MADKSSNKDSKGIVDYKPTIALRSLIDAKFVYTGKSGTPYTWAFAGDVVSVNVDDAYELLAKRIGGDSCCGNSNNGNKVFEEV